MPEFHVHVYRVEQKYEVSLDAKDVVEAKTKALALAKAGGLEPVEKDCNLIATDVFEG